MNILTKITDLGYTDDTRMIANKILEWVYPSVAAVVSGVLIALTVTETIQKIQYQFQ